MAFPFAALFPAVEKVLNLIPDPEQRKQAKLAIMDAKNTAEVNKITAELSAILVEAQSKDKFVSRARPSFLYVMYFLIGTAVPFGFLSAYNPQLATDIALGFRSWLEAIPQPIIGLFGLAYTGYTAGRSFDKWQQSRERSAQWQG